VRVRPVSSSSFICSADFKLQVQSRTSQHHAYQNGEGEDQSGREDVFGGDGARTNATTATILWSSWRTKPRTPSISALKPDKRSQFHAGIAPRIADPCGSGGAGSIRIAASALSFNSPTQSAAFCWSA
jgi:hypothetical protein